MAKAEKKKKRKRDPNRIDSTAVPIVEIHRLRTELWNAIAAKKWKTANNRAKGITKLVPLAMDPVTCRIGNGEPHLDGVYTIGTDHVMNAPQEVQERIIEMNRLIHLGKSGKWPKKSKKRKKKRKR